MVDFEREFVVKSINKATFLATEGIEYRTEEVNNGIVFIFKKSRRATEVSASYKKMLDREEDIYVNLTRYNIANREINMLIKEYRSK